MVIAIRCVRPRRNGLCMLESIIRMRVHFQSCLAQSVPIWVTDRHPDKPCSMWLLRIEREQMKPSLIYHTFRDKTGSQRFKKYIYSYMLAFGTYASRNGRHVARNTHQIAYKRIFPNEKQTNGQYWIDFPIFSSLGAALTRWWFSFNHSNKKEWKNKKKMRKWRKKKSQWRWVVFISEE